MPADDRKREYRRDMLLASTLIGAGLIISALALNVLSTSEPLQIAQATPPTQSTPGAETKPSAPSEPATTGQRPSDVPPQPARPDPDAQKAGAQPALPPAPAGEGRAADPREIVALHRHCALAKSAAGCTCVESDARMCGYQFVRGGVGAAFERLVLIPNKRLGLLQ